MADIYRLPDDVTALSDEELEQHLSAAVRSFKAESAVEMTTAQTLPNLRSLKASISTLKEEQQSRITAAAEAAAEIDALTAEVFGTEDDAASGEAETIEAAAESEATETAIETESAKVIEPTAVVTASGARRSALNVAAARAARNGTGPANNLSRYLPAENQPGGVEIVASVDVPGYRPGQEIDLNQITEGAMRRAQGLKTAGGGTGMVASYRLPFADDLIVKDSSSAQEGTRALGLASDQNRLDTGDLVASGGWCAPSETVYDITDVACPDMLWDIPEVQLNRGGLRFFRTPTLDVGALTFEWTEAQDIAADPANPATFKPCYEIPCPSPVDVRAQAVGVCLSVGILTARFFPEMVDWYVRNAMVAHEIRLRQYAFQRAITSVAGPAGTPNIINTVPVTVRASFAAFSAVYEAVALQAADMIERHNLCDSTQLEAAFPWWVKNLFLADLMRQEGSALNSTGAAEARLVDLFAQLGVRVQFVRSTDPTPDGIGGTTPATTWPGEVSFLIYPAGNFQLGRGPEVNIGVIVDSVTVATNDEKLFSEEAVVLIDRMGLARYVTVDVCPDGSVGGRNTAGALCPAEPVTP